jgi:dTDP-4-amino-4,6-dideoxygalactose transaminase
MTTPSVHASSIGTGSIPWASPAAQYRAHQAEIKAAIARVLDSGFFVLGEEVEAFERAFAAYCGVGHGIGVASGTDALELAMRALGIGPGDEVITVSHTAVATAAAVLACGATPVLVDIEMAHYTIDPSKIEAAITPRTKAIVPVHLYGQAADMDAVLAVARARGLRVIEDCAQSTGGRYGAHRLGSLGDIACFSFYPTKNLGAIGDGGMVTTDNRALAERIRRLRNYGSDRKHDHAEQGVNSRLDELQAAFLAARLPALDARNDRRRQIAARYTAELANLPGLVLPEAHSGLDHVWHLYVVRSPERDAIQGHLARAGIGTMVHYPVPPHRQAAYAGTVMAGAELPRTDLAAAQVLSLPLWPEMTDDEITHVVAQVRCAANELA